MTCAAAGSQKFNASARVAFVEVGTACVGQVGLRQNFFWWRKRHTTEMNSVVVLVLGVLVFVLDIRIYKGLRRLIPLLNYKTGL